MEAEEFYDGFAADYDRMVAWEKRLPREEGFFRRHFEAAGARRVLDAACGTGRHVAAFARMGYEAAGADGSAAMVESARAHCAALGAAADFRVAGFGRMAAAFPGRFDAVTCLGNSLPHLPDDAALREALEDLKAALRPGGLLVIQNRSYDAPPGDRGRFLPPSGRATADGEVVFLRVTDPLPGDRVSFTVLTLVRRGADWSVSARTTVLRALRRAALEAALSAAGFRDVEVAGGYAGEPFGAPGAQDLVAVARA